MRQRDPALVVIGNRGVGIAGYVDGGARADYRIVVRSSRRPTRGRDCLRQRRTALNDLAFLRPQRLYAMGTTSRPDLVIVVVDNDGGGIFGQLEQSSSLRPSSASSARFGLDLAAVARRRRSTASSWSTTSRPRRRPLDAAVSGSVRVIVAKVGDRAEAASLRDIQTDVGAASSTSTTLDEV